jgi:hypothetical protein
MEIVLAELEQEVADENAFDDTFDLELDDTREIAIPEPIVDENAWTQPYELGPAPRDLS